MLQGIADTHIALYSTSSSGAPAACLAYNDNAPANTIPGSTNGQDSLIAQPGVAAGTTLLLFVSAKDFPINTDAQAGLGARCVNTAPSTCFQSAC